MLNFWNKLSIKWKIFVFLLFFCFILLCFLWTAQVLFLDRFYKSIRTNEIRDISSVIATSVDDYGFFDARIMNDIVDSYNVCLEIATSSGYPLYSICTSNNCIIHRMTSDEKRSLYAAALENRGEYTRTYQYTSIVNTIRRSGMRHYITFEEVPEESLVYANILVDDYGSTALLLVNAIITPVGTTANTLRVQLNFITSFAVLFSILLALLISKRVSKPIEKINKTAKQLAASDYDVVFEETGYKEINELAATLNFTAKELSKVESLRKELIANVSHDLRTPLTLISGYAEAIRDLPSDDNTENIQIIIDESRRLSSLVADLLDISKLQSGMDFLNLTKYNLTETVRKTIFTISELVKKDGYKINFIKDEDIYITADELKISQTIYNLLINAVNYAGEDKTVIVKQTVSSSHVRLIVTDMGEGISEEDLPHIWDRYYRVEKNHKRSITGSGLGLSIVKQIIMMHEGNCGVSSGVGKGSTFWIELKRDAVQQTKNQLFLSKIVDKQI